jgi:fucose permease
MKTRRLNRLSVCLLFLTTGVVNGSWASRIPDIKRHVHLDDARWGAINISATAGAAIALIVVALLVGRLGPRRLALAGVPLLLLDAPLVAMAPRAAILAVGLLILGLGTGLVSTPMNAQAVEVERIYGRRIMSSFHACFSLGALTGGVCGTVAAHLGVSPGDQLAVTSAVLGLALLSTLSWMPVDEPGALAGRRLNRNALRNRQLVLLGVIALLSSLAEGSASQWSALYTANALSAGAAAGAATYTCYTLATTITRSRGDVLVQRLGRPLFLRLASAVAASGLGFALAVGRPWAAYVGFAVLGVGVACIIPTVYGLSGNQAGLSPGEGLTVASAGQWPAFLAGPPIIGALAGLFGLRAALILAVLAPLAVTVLAGRVREPAPPGARVRRSSQPAVRSAY